MASDASQPVVSLVRVFIGATLVVLAYQVYNEGHDLAGTAIYLVGLTIAVPGSAPLVAKLLGLIVLGVIYYIVFSGYFWLSDSVRETIQPTYWEWIGEHWVFTLIGAIVYVAVGYIWGPEPGQKWGRQ